MSRCGICRICYRKRKVILIVFATALFWIIYLILILPDNNGYYEVKSPKSTKQVMTQSTHTRVFPQKKVIHIQSNNDGVTLNLVKPVGGDHISLNISFKEKKDDSKVSSSTTTRQAQLQIVKHLQNLKNNTLNLGAKMKETLSDLGIITKKEYVKHIKRQSVFTLSMSQNEYMHIIKTLIESENSRKAVTQQHHRTHSRPGLPAVNNSCICYDISCSCCVRLQISMLELRNIVCANITFRTKTQELDLKFSLDRRIIYNETISAQHPPTICMGSLSNSLEICSTFSNMSFHVNMHDDHKTQLNGCIDFSLAVYNRTISAFHLGCFQIPGAGQRPYEINDLGNWMP